MEDFDQHPRNFSHESSKYLAGSEISGIMIKTKTLPSFQSSKKRKVSLEPSAFVMKTRRFQFCIVLQPPPQ
jgi:hypothetical protein